MVDPTWTPSVGDRVVDLADEAEGAIYIGVVLAIHGSVAWVRFPMAFYDTVPFDRLRQA